MPRLFKRSRGWSTMLGLALGASTLSAASCGAGDHYPGVEDGLAPNGGTGSNSGPEPNFAAPPISGGTLLLLRDGKTAVAADPDRDRVSVVDLVNHSVTQVIALGAGDEPGRLAEDSSGVVHVALRRGGAVVAFRPDSGEVLSRRVVCPAPRGVAYQAAGDLIHVACAGGELVSLPAAGGAPARNLRLARDLRDVVVSGDRLFVSRFRAAEIITLDASGDELRRQTPLEAAASGGSFEPGVAWSMKALPSGDLLVAHQRASTAAIAVGPQTTGSYSSAEGGCSGGSVVQTAVSVIAADGTAASGPPPALPEAALPVDLAISSDGAKVALVSAGNRVVYTAELAELLPNGDECNDGLETTTVSGGPIAAAFTSSGTLVIQTRQPAALLLGATHISLGGDDVSSTGHRLFHDAPTDESGFATSVACASCHPEGREDGRVWQFSPGGARRTQSLAGDITDTAPFHWAGDEHNFSTLMTDVFVRRMGGRATEAKTGANYIPRWLATVPAPPPSAPVDESAVGRGQALFESADIGCTDCHSGPKHTNNTTVDVGTGGRFQVPWLVGVGWRAPYLHDGCAQTLEDRFGACATDAHGNTSGLSASQISDLVAFLESL